MDNDRITRASRHFERLMGLYPAEYRKRFGAEMVQVFRTMYRARLSNNESIMELWVQTYIDIGVNAMAQSVKTKSTNDDAIGRTIIVLSKLTNWLGVLLLWAFLAAILDISVARPLYNLLSPGELGVGVTATGQITLNYFAWLLNATFGLCLIPFIALTRRQWREKLAVVLLGAAAFAVMPPVVTDIVYFGKGYSTVLAFGPFILFDLAVVAAIFVLAKAFVLIRRRQITADAGRKLVRPYLIPIAAIGVAFILERITNYRGIATASTIDFTRILLHHEIQILLLLATTVFVLMALTIAKRHIAYFVFCMLVILSSINYFSLQISHNEYCQQLVTNVMLMQDTKYLGDPDHSQLNAYQTQLKHNCGSQYDLTEQFVSAPDTSR